MKRVIKEKKILAILFVGVFAITSVFALDDLFYVNYSNSLFIEHTGTVGWLINGKVLAETGFIQNSIPLNANCLFFGVGLPFFKQDNGFFYLKGKLLYNYADTKLRESVVAGCNVFFYKGNVGLSIGGEYGLFLNNFTLVTYTGNLAIGLLYSPKRIQKIKARETAEAQRLQEQQESLRQERQRQAEFNQRQIDSRLELARELTKNPNMTVSYLESGLEANISNPYVFDKNVVYYCENMSVEQWKEKSFLADLNYEGIRLQYYNEDNDTYIFIRNVYDVTKIKRNVQGAYLRYVGVYRYTTISGKYAEVPEFDLLYSF